MIKVTVILALVFLALGFSAASFADNPPCIPQNLIAVTDDDNPNAGLNTGTIFQICPPGVIAAATLPTTGTGLGGGYFAAPRVSIAANDACIFIADPGSNDIAAFRRSTASLTVFVPAVPFLASSPLLNGTYAGIGLAVSPKFLYAAYSGSDNIASWAITPNLPGKCSLTLVPGSITANPDAVAALAVSGNGNTLVVSEPNNEFLDSYQLAGGIPTLRSHISTSSCGFPAGVDIADNGLVVTGEATLSQTYCTAALSGSTLGAVNGNSLSGAGTAIGNLENPIFNKAAYTTSTGYVYFGMSGFGGGGGFADPGFTVNRVTAGVINPAVVSFYDATVNPDAPIYGSSLGTSTVNALGLQGVVWQVDVSAALTNTVWAYTVGVGGGPITPYARLLDPNAPGWPVLSITAYPLR
jgi:hypothetical protein